MSNEVRNPIQSVGTTFDVLAALKDLDGAGVTELAASLGRSKSTAHNYLRSLEENGYVTNEDGTYYIGTQILEYGDYARRRHDIYQIAKPEVDQLAKETGELTNLVIEEHGLGVYLYRGRGADAVNVQAHVGASAHLHCTAVGKAILAHLPRQRTEEIVDTHGLPAHTSETITDPDVLFAELDEIRDRGLAFDREERLEGLQCIASPIRSTSGRVLGSISISAPTHRTRDEGFMDEMSTRIKDVAHLIDLNVTFP